MILYSVYLQVDGCVLLEYVVQILTHSKRGLLACFAYIRTVAKAVL